MQSGTDLTQCHKVIAQLWAYIDGELTPERMDEIRAHLEMCHRCYPQYDFQRAFLAFIARVGDQPLPRQLRRRVFERLLAEERGDTVA
ncbi:MAG: zf-HC2 domain-containing protein [Gemmatimonadota bacterium]